MAGVLTSYGAQQFLAAVLTPDLYVPPATLALAVTLTVPPANAEGEDLDEPDPAVGYDRVAYGLDSTWWAPSGGGEMFNSQQAAMPTITALAGLAQGWAVVDDVTIGAGNVWAVGQVLEPYMLDVGVIPFFDIGDVLISLGG